MVYGTRINNIGCIISSEILIPYQQNIGNIDTIIIRYKYLYFKI